jgi:ubiquinone/menaquinone biosynthesis C-methylase UbiE
MTAKSNFKDHFSGVAGRYAEFRPEYPRELFSWLASLPTKKGRAWDCASGNGQAAVHLAEFFDDVIATDASAGQIENARPHHRIRYVVAPAEQSTIPDASVDLVTVAQAAHWFDLTRFYSEAKRVLRPGAPLVIWCYGTCSFEHPQIDELVDDFYRNVVGPYWPPERRLIEEDYRTIEFPLREIAAPKFDMQAQFTLERLVGYLRTWSATQRFLKERGSDPVTPLEQKLAPLWANGEPRRAATWPIHIRAGVFGSD